MIKPYNNLLQNTIFLDLKILFRRKTIEGFIYINKFGNRVMNLGEGIGLNRICTKCKEIGWTGRGGIIVFSVASLMLTTGRDRLLESSTIKNSYFNINALKQCCSSQVYIWFYQNFKAIHKILKQ